VPLIEWLSRTEKLSHDDAPGSIGVILPGFVVIVGITWHAVGCRAVRAARFRGDQYAMFQFELKRTTSRILKSLIHKWLRPESVSFA
jgi:hypothetical protein